MKSPIKLLSLVVRATVLLLTGSAVLVVLSIFNASLHWDIFSPAAEKVLYGIFGSFVALGGFGAAISLVLGIHEVVTSFRRLVDRAHPESAPAAVEAPRKSYLVALAAVLVVLVLTISGFGLANRRITAHRIEVFKLIAQDQMQQLDPRLATEVAGIQKPCNSCGTPTMAASTRWPVSPLSATPPSTCRTPETTQSSGAIRRTVSTRYAMHHNSPRWPASSSPRTTTGR